MYFIALVLMVVKINLIFACEHDKEFAFESFSEENCFDKDALESVMSLNCVNNRLVSDYFLSKNGCARCAIEKDEKYLKNNRNNEHCLRGILNDVYLRILTHDSNQEDFHMQITLNNKNYSIFVRTIPGLDSCPIDVAFDTEISRFTISNEKSELTVHGSLPYMIKNYGFFGGKGAPRRISPKRLAGFFGI